MWDMQIWPNSVISRSESLEIGYVKDLIDYTSRYLYIESYWCLLMKYIFVLYLRYNENKWCHVELKVKVKHSGDIEMHVKICNHHVEL